MKLKLFDIFRTPSARTLAQRQLEDAERNLLASKSQAEYAHKMAEYYEGMVIRLSAELQKTQF